MNAAAWPAIAGSVGLLGIMLAAEVEPTLVAALGGAGLGFWRGGRGYSRNVWVGLDIASNGAGGGAYKQTWSDRIGDKVRGSRFWARLLDVPFLGHFLRTVEDREAGGFWRTSLGTLVGALPTVGLLAAVLLWGGPLGRYVFGPYLGGTFAWVAVGSLRDAAVDRFGG